MVEAKYQPVKIAAAEAQWETCQPCSFSAFQVGGGNERPHPVPDHPDPAPALPPGHQPFNGKVEGLNQIQKEDEKKYGPGNYIPDVFIQYWSMRIMAYISVARSCCSPCGAHG